MFRSLSICTKTERKEATKKAFGNMAQNKTLKMGCMVEKKTTIYGVYMTGMLRRVYTTEKLVRTSQKQWYRPLPTIVHLNVGGHFFTTRLTTLLKDKDSMLAAMFSGRFKLEVDDQGRYFIDRDGKYFGYILNYLRDASLLPEASVALQVYREAQYFRVEELIRQLERYPCVIPYVVLEEQKKKLTEEKYQHWKSVLLETTQRKYSQVVNSSVGHDCVVVMTRYTSKSDYELGDSICKSHTSACKHKENCNEHRFFSVDESGEVVQHYIGSDLPLVDFVVPDEDIADCRLFTSLVEKDLRVEGFCVSGSLSHSWRCLKCDVTGFLHQMAFRMYLPSLAKIIENDPGTN